MQDVCISVWNDDPRPENNFSGDDVELKITDVCSTNPQDPTYCATPSDIKIDRRKADILYSNIRNLTSAERNALHTGTEYPGKVWWFFRKCWDDGLAQPAYNTTSNWFTIPPLPNNEGWGKAAITQQYLNNAAN